MFEPAFGAFSDSWLQIRAKPSVFLFIWLSLSIAPLLILAVLFLQPLADALNELMRLFQVLFTSGEDPAAIADEYRRAFFQYIRTALALVVLLTVSSSFMGSVLFGTINRFRSREMPTFTGSIKDGGARFVRFFLTVLAAGFRIYLMYMAGSFMGAALGLAMGDLFYSPLIFTGFFLFAGLLRYALAPFIQLAGGMGVRDAVRTSRAYHRAARPVVAGLFLTSFLLPALLLVSLFNLFSQAGALGGVGKYLIGFLLGFFQFILVIVLINFSMNQFHTAEAGRVSASADPLDNK